MKIWSEKNPKTNKKEWCADFRVAGSRHRPRAATRNELDDIVAAIKRRSRQEKYGLDIERAVITLKELAEKRIGDFDQKKPSGRRASVILRDFVERFPAGFTVAELSAIDLRDFVKERRQEFIAKEREKLSKAEPDGEAEPRSISPETINKELGYISAMLSDAPNLFKELQDYRPPKMPWAKASRRKRRRPITEEEDERLLAALRAPLQAAEHARTMFARHEVADIFEINLNTGMRGGESVRLTWPQIDFKGGEIYLGKTKNGEDRLVPMNSRVLEIFRRRFDERNGSRFVFPNPSGASHRCDYLRTFKRVAVASGLPYGRKNENGFTMHSTRHTATTRLLRAGADVATVQEIVGHSDRSMTLHYSHASDKTRKRAVESLIRKPVDKKRTSKKRDGTK